MLIFAGAGRVEGADIVDGHIGLPQTFDAVVQLPIGGVALGCDAETERLVQGGNVPYAVVPIHTADPSGEILHAELLEDGTTIADTLLYLYCSFNPADPGSGLIAMNDDAPGTLLSHLPASRGIFIEPNRTYFLIVAPFRTTDIGFGQFRLSLGGQTRSGVSPTEGLGNPLLSIARTRRIFNQRLLEETSATMAGAVSPIARAALQDERHFSLSFSGGSAAAPVEGTRLGLFGAVASAQFGDYSSQTLDGDVLLGVGGGWWRPSERLAIGLGAGHERAAAMTGFNAGEVEGRADWLFTFAALEVAEAITLDGMLAYANARYEADSVFGERSAAYTGERYLAAARVTGDLDLGGPVQRMLALEDAPALGLTLSSGALGAAERLSGFTDDLGFSYEAETLKTGRADLTALLNYAEDLPFAGARARAHAGLSGQWRFAGRRIDDQADAAPAPEFDLGLRLGTAVSLYDYVDLSVETTLDRLLDSDRVSTSTIAALRFTAAF